MKSVDGDEIWCVALFCETDSDCSGVVRTWARGLPEFKPGHNNQDCTQIKRSKGYGT